MKKLRLGRGPDRTAKTAGADASGPAAPADPASPTGPSSDGPEFYGPDPDSPEERARRGRWRLVVAGALFATLILPKVISSADYSDPAAAQPAPSPSASSVPSYPTQSPDAGAGPTPSLPTYSASPTAPAPADSGPSEPAAGSAPARPSADPAAPVFRSVRAGQCLAIHSNGKGWSRATPAEAARVGCGSDRAYIRVTAVRTSGETCAAGNGRASWSHGDTTLCLTRQFRTGQCLLAESSAGDVRAALMSAPACSTERPSGSYNRLLKITAVHDDTDETCRTGPADRTRYWTWRVDGGSRLICATPADDR